MLSAVEQHVFDEVSDILHSLVPPELGELHARAQRYGIKVWFESEKAPREHYEAQVMNRKNVDGRNGVALEVGFHAEHTKPADNEAVLARLTGKEKAWRKVLGPDASAGEFYGTDRWRRLSEAWFEFDLGDPELPMEIAERLTDYIVAVEGVLRSKAR
jgi:hypothetical protein